MKHQTVCLHVNIYIELDLHVLLSHQLSPESSVIWELCMPLMQYRQLRVACLSLCCLTWQCTSINPKGVIYAIAIKEIFWCCFLKSSNNIDHRRGSVACIRTRFKRLLGPPLDKIWMTKYLCRQRHIWRSQASNIWLWHDCNSSAWSRSRQSSISLGQAHWWWELISCKPRC